MVMVRHRNGILQEMTADDAERLLKAGVIEMAGTLLPLTYDDVLHVMGLLEDSCVSLTETAMLAPAETAMLPAAQSRKRGRPRKAKG